MQRTGRRHRQVGQVAEWNVFQSPHTIQQRQGAAVAEAVTPIAGAIGGMTGVMKGLSSLFGGHELRRQAGNVLNPANPITVKGLRKSIEALDEWIEGVRPLVEGGRASEAVENQYWLNLQRRQEFQAQLDRLLSQTQGSAADDDEQGQVTYTTTVTITDATAKDLVAKISTNSTYLDALNSSIKAMDNTIKAWSPTANTQASDILSPEGLAAIKGLLEYDLLSPEQQSVIKALIADQVLTAEEMEVLRNLANYHLLPEEAKAAIADILSDGIITDDELTILKSLLAGDIPPIEIADPPPIKVELPSREAVTAIFGEAIANVTVDLGSIVTIPPIDLGGLGGYGGKIDSNARSRGLL